MEQEILEKLKSHPPFRERSNRDKFIAILSARKLGLIGDVVKPSDIVSIPFSRYSEFLPLTRTYDRLWRKLTAENVELRGSDYGNKESLEEDKLLELGYTTCTPEQEKEFGL